MQLLFLMLKSKREKQIRFRISTFKKVLTFTCCGKSQHSNYLFKFYVFGLRQYTRFNYARLRITTAVPTSATSASAATA